VPSSPLRPGTPYRLQTAAMGGYGGDVGWGQAGGGDSGRVRAGGGMADCLRSGLVRCEGDGVFLLLFCDGRATELLVDVVAAVSLLDVAPASLAGRSIRQ
jgi:hypothetical protein